MARILINGLPSDGDERGEPDGDRDEKEVVDGRDGKLPARQVERIHGVVMLPVNEDSSSPLK